MTLQEVWSLLNLYKSSFSGEQIDEAIGMILNGGISAAVDAAQKSADAAAKSASEAAGSAASVGAAATNAQSAASRADGSATEAESYAHGGTGKREGEDEDNARYYSEEAKKAAGNAAADAVAEAKNRLTQYVQDAEDAKKAAEDAAQTLNSAQINAVGHLILTAPDGSTRDLGDVTGEDGSSIASITRTAGNGAPGTTDTYTVTLTDGSKTQFQVYNGKDGKSAFQAAVDGGFTGTETQFSDGLADIALTFDKFPTEEEINDLPNWSYFKTRGFYEKNDGLAATYQVKTSAATFYVPYGNMFIRPVMTNWDTRDIYVDLYGVRRGSADYAVRNSEIMDALASTLQNGFTFHFASGHYYFDNPIVLNKYVSLKGVVSDASLYSNPDVSSDPNYGSYLHFPNLADGEAAISILGGVVENLEIAGNPSICDVSLDRSKTVTNPDAIVSLVDTGTTYGIKAEGNHTIHGVKVRNCTYGIYAETANALISNIDILKCKVGISVGNDIKINNVQVWNAMVGIELRGQLASATNIRGDSIGKHLIECKKGKCLLTNVDGDYCVGSLIHYGGGDVPYIHIGQAIACMGRVATKYAYARNSGFNLQNVPDADYEYCSYISIAPNTQVFGGQIDIVNVSANPLDGDSSYLTPNAAISIGTGSTVKGLIVKCNIPHDADAAYFHTNVIKNLSTYAEASNDTANYLTDFDGSTIEDIGFVTPSRFVRTLRTVANPTRVLDAPKDGKDGIGITNIDIEEV